MRTLFLSLILAVTIISCTTTSKSASSTTVTSVGKSCGMCLGKCYNGYRINNGVVEQFSAERLDKMESAIIEKATAEQEKAFRELINLLPSNLDTYPDRIGCPDCHDQCGIQVVTSTRTIVIDPADYPTEFNKFMEKLKEMGVLNR
ncbi:MAG TPA: hypothetical protein VHM26_18320 [Chitinophagaceae bacterium]|jgi:hypothetical protein|nr:hypothetical protein [Chitinophagaceae bacterium]